MRIYRSAPLFSQAHRRWNRDFAEAVVAGWTYAPPISIVLPQEFEGQLGRMDKQKKKLFRHCTNEIEDCTALIAILDGNDTDSGVNFEVGVAWKKQKPIVGVRTDVRLNRPHGVNLMTEKGVKAYVRHHCSNYNKLLQKIYQYDGWLSEELYQRLRKRIDTLVDQAIAEWSKAHEALLIV